MYMKPPAAKGMRREARFLTKGKRKKPTSEPGIAVSGDSRL